VTGAVTRGGAARRSLVRIGALAGKEAMHIRRDPTMLYIALVLPLVLLVLFGYGISFDIDHIPLVVVDHDHTPESRALVDDFAAAHEFELKGVADDADRAPTLFARGQAAAVLTIPTGYAEALSRGESVAAALQLDGADARVAQSSLARADVMAQVATRRVVASRLPAGAGALPLTTSTWTRFNPAGKSALFLVPGLTAYVLALVSVLLTALTVAREWERGSMEQLFATPVSRFEIVVGKLLPYMGMGTVQFLLVLTAGTWVFGVPLKGDLGLLAVSAFLFMIGMLGQGLLISIVARNQMVATQAATMSSMLPSMLLSGFMFPIANMPWVLQLVSHLVPARYFIAILRGVLLKGNGWSELWPDVLLLAGFATLMLVASTRRFDRKLA
jgi:ABC-2 type transport system permease protein